MKKKTRGFLPTASIALATALALSCLSGCISDGSDTIVLPEPPRWNGSGTLRNSDMSFMGNSQMPTSTTSYISNVQFGGGASAGGTSSLTVTSSQPLSELYLQVKGESGYYVRQLSSSDLVSSSNGSYVYSVPLQYGQQLGGGGQLQFTIGGKTTGQQVSSVREVPVACTSCGGGSSSSRGGTSSSSGGGVHVHNWGDWVATTATCTEVGAATRTCIDDPSHTETGNRILLWDEWVTTKTPAICSVGEETRICRGNASQTETSPIAPIIPEGRYCSGGTVKDYGSLTDARDGKTYKTVVIGTQTWMAENLNYNTTGKCYGNNQSNCNIYGRLYNWAVATGSPNSCAETYGNCTVTIQPKHRGICPEGWHLPSNEEWEVLVNHVDPNWTPDYECELCSGPDNVAGTKLKATSGWRDNTLVTTSLSGNGTDEYGFSALPGSEWISGLSRSNNISESGTWWSSTRTGSTGTYSFFWRMNYVSNRVDRDYQINSEMLSIRCIED